MVRIVPDQFDLFIADALDIKVKGDISMGADNFFSVSKNPRYTPIVQYQTKGRVTVTPTAGRALATLYDEDLMLFLISQLVNRMDTGGGLGSTIQFFGRDFYKFMRRSSYGGSDYQKIWDGLDRLHNTLVEVTLDDSVVVEEEIDKGDLQFHWLADIGRKYKVRSDGSQYGHLFEVSVPPRLLKAIRSRKVLTYDKAYFKINSPIERWMYRFVRKSVGQGKDERFKFWSYERLHEKSASEDSLRQFKQTIKRILKRNKYRLFQYTVEEASKGHDKGLYFDVSPYYSQTSDPLIIEANEATMDSH